MRQIASTFFIFFGVTPPGPLLSAVTHNLVVSDEPHNNICPNLGNRNCHCVAPKKSIKV